MQTRDENHRKSQQVNRKAVIEQRKNSRNQFLLLRMFEFRQSLMFPNKRIQCNDCRRDISKTARMLADQLDYCISCFANLDDYPRTYHAINKLDFPLFDSKWSAEDELLLFQGLQKHGFGNWAEIAEFLSNGKSQEEIQAHYLNTYLQSPSFIPRGQLLSRRDSQGKLLKPFKDQITKKSGKNNTKNSNTNNPTSFQKGSITINNSLATQIKQTNPTEIVGFMPKRGDFQVQYDNDAELLLAELQFNEDDRQQEKQMKFRIIDIYNQKLTERIRRKQFVLSRNLLDLKEQTRLEKNRSKQQKEMHNMMKIFARFSTAQDHEKLVQGVLKEKELRRKIEELKQLKAKGYRNLSEIDYQQRQKPKDTTKIKEKNDISYKPNNSSKEAENKKLKRESMKEKEASKQDLLTKEQELLCQKIKLAPKTYIIVRQTIIRQSVRKGFIQKEQAFRMFKLEKSIFQPIYEFLLAKNQINFSQ